MVNTLIYILAKSLYVYNFNLFNITSCPNFKTVQNYKWVFQFFDGFIQEFFSYFISYFNDTIDRLAFIQQKVLQATENKETSVATLLNDVNLPCSYRTKFSAKDSCEPSRIVSFLWNLIFLTGKTSTGGIMQCPKKHVKDKLFTWWHMHFFSKCPKIEEFHDPFLFPFSESERKMGKILKNEHEKVGHLKKHVINLKTEMEPK